jgi:hypothetical protein
MLLIEQLRVDVGDDATCRALPRRSTSRTPTPCRHRRARARPALQADLDAGFAAHLAPCLRDAAHAANGMAPGALLAVHLAEDVVEQHIGAARRIGAGIVADHRVEAERRLDRLAFEPAVRKRRAPTW